MTDTNTEQTEHTAAQILERLEAEGHDYHRQIRILVDALALELHRLSDDQQRVVACDELVAMLRAAAAAPPFWPVPSRSAVLRAMSEAAGKGEGAVMGYCLATRHPFTIAINAKGEPIRFSVGRPRTEIEQAEAERQATRAVFKQGGLKVVDDDDTIH